MPGVIGNRPHELEKKIDHPPGGGSKDTTDAVAGALANAIASREASSLRVPCEPSVIAGIHPHAYPAEVDPFNMLGRIPPRPTRVFDC
jgi:hypothetical protein